VDDGARQRGEQLFEEIVGAPAPAGAGPYFDMTIEHVFGRVWARDDLSRRDRRLLTLGILSTMGEYSSMEVHMRQALESGELTPEELHGVVVFIGQYAGWPRGGGAFVTACRVIDAYRASRTPKPDG
jgi:4-carboxymuconolactone decarboxylase